VARLAGTVDDTVLSQLAHSQVRLFLVAPTNRQTHPEPLGPKRLFDFDHAISFFSETEQYRPAAPELSRPC
jgi:hypothetical protein